MSDLIGYEQYIPPFALDFRAMPPAQAKVYFQWFCEHIEPRMQALQYALDANEGVVSLDFTPSSFEPVGVWFERKAERRRMTDTEIEAQEASVPDWLKGSLEVDTLTTQTLSLCIDTGMYFGETMRRCHPILKWDYVKRPKTSADFHEPVLVGFLHRIIMNPVRLMQVFANQSTTRFPYSNNLIPGEGGKRMRYLFDRWSNNAQGKF